MFQSSEKATLSTSSLPLRTAANVTRVSFDARVLMQLIQNDHLSIHTDEGYVFGVIIDEVLEVTNSISLPPERLSTDYETDQQRELAHMQFLEERQKYQTAVAESFRKVNMDSEVVGWYTVAFPEGPTSKSTVETQLHSQLENPHFVMITYDPFLSMSGTLHLKVLRLTQKYIKFHTAGDFTQHGVSKAALVNEDIYEEVPYSVHVPLLTRVFLYETNFGKTADSEGLPRDGNAVMGERDIGTYMQRALGDVAHSLDTLSRDLGECTGKPLRRKGKDHHDANARYNSLLLARELPTSLAHISDIGAQYTQGAVLSSILATNQMQTEVDEASSSSSSSKGTTLKKK